METNVGSTDKLVRIVVGAVAGLVSLAVLADAVALPVILAPLLGVVSVILLGTAVTGFCGLYTVLGINTCPIESR